tara:strand:- start:143 stop:685 length:543 start_codon:yes stop_codon:yes gene_type:complete
MENERSLLDRGIESLDTTVSSPRNIKGFTTPPPKDLKLYVKYRGDISPGNNEGRELFPLGYEPKNIEGIITDARIYKKGMRFLIMLKVTNSPDSNDIGKEISIYPSRDLVSLYPPPLEITKQKLLPADLDGTRNPPGDNNLGGRRRRKKRKTKRKSRKSKKRRRKKRKTRRKRKSRRKRR